jgi:hypothetical protein
MFDVGNCLAQPGLAVASVEESTGESRQSRA